LEDLGKAEREPQENSLPKRKSEELLETLLCPPGTGRRSVYSCAEKRL